MTRIQLNARLIPATRAFTRGVSDYASNMMVTFECTGVVFTTC